jgi:para-aminobenzoate synthetase component I
MATELAHAWLRDPLARAMAIAGLAQDDPPELAWLDGGDEARGFLGEHADVVVEDDTLAAVERVDRMWRAAPEQIWLGCISFDFAADLARARPVRARALPGVTMRRYRGALELGPGPRVLAHPDRAAITTLLARLEHAHVRAQDGAQEWPLDPLVAELAPEDYRARVQQAQRHIAAGDTYQVNFAQRFTAGWRRPVGANELAARAAALYLRLRARAPAELGAWMRTPTGVIVSNSPETLIEVRRGVGEGGHDLAFSRPIKGTRPRGATPEQDARARAELRASEKDRAEHLMIVDLVRNDLGRLALPGSVVAPAVPTELALPTVHHLVSEVQATLRPGVGLRDLVLALLPGGSVTGAPKRRTLEIIESLEHVPRGIYCGAIVLLEPAGLRMSIPIRTGVLDRGGLHLHAGGGIVIDSDPEAERIETWDKTRAFAP